MDHDSPDIRSLKNCLEMTVTNIRLMARHKLICQPFSKMVLFSSCLRPNSVRLYNMMSNNLFVIKHLVTAFNSKVTNIIYDCFLVPKPKIVSKRSFLEVNFWPLLVLLCRIKYLPPTYDLALFNETFPHHFMPHNMYIVVLWTRDSRQNG